MRFKRRSGSEPSEKPGMADSPAVGMRFSGVREGLQRSRMAQQVSVKERTRSVAPLNPRECRPPRVRIMSWRPWR